MADLRVTYDATADAAYIHFRDAEAGASKDQVPVEHAPGMTVLDLDADGRIIGVEVVGARDALPASLLDQAERL